MIRRFFSWLSNWTHRHWVEFFAAGAVFLLLLLVLWPLIVYTVPPGSVGVMWYRFFGGTVTKPNTELREGIHFIFPWDKIYMYDARLQRINESVKGLSVDGLEITVDVSSRFVINRQYAGYLHKSLGPQYKETLMRPQLRTLILTYISENEASDLYSTRRERVQTIVQTRFQSKLANISSNVPFEEAYVDLEDVLIEEITLPSFVRSAIEQKERVRHMSEAYDFRLRLEEKERQRKRIEAEGIRSFQEIVAPGITPSYLRWRGIEATLQLAQSNNAKVVIIGGENGLPIILNTESGLETIGEDQKKRAAQRPPGGETSGYSDPTQFGPRSDLLKMPSLAGPPPLTASGAPLRQNSAAPPDIPQEEHGPSGTDAGTVPTVGGIPVADPNAQNTLREWLGKLTGSGTPAPASSPPPQSN
ncbi:prohibitin family protein [Nisaea acidiphila]|uniref:Prohibitin family protein n=1 Tax=Nisaea acidiphila TaxID=1862145 RepID=A0A9J7APD5_9PROT|nr:prohibitin family protein [Nisaea acidiphila]UUX48457.1 prohibitin family protein [Nisaea acidiphila]